VYRRASGCGTVDVLAHCVLPVQSLEVRMTQTIVGHFASSDSAQRALESLEESGFTSEDVSYVAQDGAGRFADLLRGKVSSRSGTARGAAAGGVSGILLGLAALAIPGIGPVVAAGPLAAALAGAGVGAATGGLLGALADMGVPEQQGRHWADRVAQGGTLVLVRANDDTAERAESALASAGAEEIRSHRETVQASGGYDPADPHTTAADYGDEGGSSQWGQTVLRVDGDETRVAERTFSRDRKPEKLD
jgi:uncharacterized membrane protein